MNAITDHDPAGASATELATLRTLRDNFTSPKRSLKAVELGGKFTKEIGMGADGLPLGISIIFESPLDKEKLRGTPRPPRRPRSVKEPAAPITGKRAPEPPPAPEHVTPAPFVVRSALDREKLRRRVRL